VIDHHETLYEQYAIRGHFTLLFLIIYHEPLLTWWSCILLRWKH